MLLPDRELEPDDLVELFVHEMHALAAIELRPSGGVKYLQHREYRAGTAEAPAFAASLAYRWARRHELPLSLDGFVSILRDGYDAQGPREVAHDVIEIRATEIAHGVIRSELARLAIAVTYRDQPDALRP